MEKRLEEALVEGAKGLGADLDEEALGRFDAYLEELAGWNRKINLTSITGEREIVERHFLDSLAPLCLLGEAATLLDMGSGGGFPGIPLKIARPALSVTLLDSVSKKVHFMRHVIRRLGLESIEAVHGRAEDQALVNELAARTSGGFDCVISRAFADLGEFLGLALPYARPGGLVIAMKGPKGASELAAFEAGASGGAGAGSRLEEVREVKVAGRVTTLISLRKTAL